MGWEQLWLNYQRKEDYPDKEYFTSLYQMNEGYLICNAVEEIARAAQEIFSISIAVKNFIDEKPGIILKLNQNVELGEDGYSIQTEGNKLLLTARHQKGILYGVFHIIRQAQQGKRMADIKPMNIPVNRYRMLNHWDDFNGDIERGYAGRSFFFQENDILVNERTVDYARLMASIGINQVAINNVNVKDKASELITEKYFSKLKEISEIFEGYGIQLFISINFASSIDIGGMDTADPLNDRVRGWWKGCAEKIYQNIPNFGGFLVKADSEGRPGPFTYQRTHADGANMLAKAVEPFGGTIIWRCFVYDCEQDWRDVKTDRAKAAYDNFLPMDGKFADNVILQIKNGPMDFQVREPVSPLFGALKHTNQMLEVQITQEYTGQQIDLCYLIPMWKEVLDYHTGCQDAEDTVGDIISGKTFGDMKCGIAAVANTGNDENWTGHDLAAANLYGFGRLAWETSLSAEEIAYEWTAATLVQEKEVLNTTVSILMSSWPAYENYTSPLGTGWMVNPNHHYGPNVDGYEYDAWGTYHRADHRAIGVDRSAKGTGYAMQYQRPNAAVYDSIETCPLELLLFFHRIPYMYELKNGKTLIQHIYDTHFDGVEQVEEMIERWDSIKDNIDLRIYERIKARFLRQLDNSKNWRDVINTYFYRKSLIPDEKGRPIY